MAGREAAWRPAGARAATASAAQGVLSMSDNERRRRLDSVIPELIKRAVEIGVEKAAEAPDNLKEFVGGMKLPREVANYLLAQVEETKNGLFRVVAKEIREFLEHTNLGAEMQKMLTTVQFEINTTIRFKPNEGAAPGTPGEGEGAKLPKPEVKAEVQVKRPEDRPRERRRSRE
jgi:hypothetical protein